jgi:hypothetical protein
MANVKPSEVATVTEHLMADFRFAGSRYLSASYSKAVTEFQYIAAMLMQNGTIVGGKIAVTVAANNLTAALKTTAGNDPSANEPVYTKINNAVYVITGALSVTVNAAANTFNSGSAELATKTVGYFPYLAYRAASSVVVLGFARIPWGRLGSDFSSTATAESYCAWSTAPAAGDNVVNIGYFEATLSAGAGYTWTVPTFTSTNLRNQPTFESNWLDWTPAQSASGSLTWTTLSITRARYRMGIHKVEHEIHLSATLGGTASNILYLTVPYQHANTNVCGMGNTAGVTSLGWYPTAATPNKFSIQKYDGSNYATSGSCAVNGYGFYEA